uniref:DNA damage-binding protein 1 n=1 Tax=Aureoumbra lagunensis TaxID=44058 RepID=A0A7S3JPX3_9STRA
MVAAVEKQKFAYVLNRDASQNLTISSPLEAHKAHTIVFDLCAIDVGFENPVFAVLELDFTNADQDPTGEAARDTEKMLTYYELDLGLNHVTRRWSEPVARTANLLLSVPGGEDGPSGVLVCGENWIAYKRENHAEVRTPLPRRKNFPNERGLLIISTAALKQKDMFFFLVLSEIGDLYKVTLEYAKDKTETNVFTVANVIVSVFDTIFPANALCITKTGLLFAAAEFGDHALFQFQALGEEATAIANSIFDPALGDDAQSAAKVAPRFEASAQPKNLLLIDELESLCAPTCLHALNTIGTNSDSPLLVACRGGQRPALDMMRRGCTAQEMAQSELPGRPSAVWTVRSRIDDDFDKYIVLSFTNATMILSIGDTVEEVNDSGFLTDTPTLEVALLADNALLQAYVGGLRHIRGPDHINEWKGRNQEASLTCATANERQVTVCTASSEITYLELDASGILTELGTKELGTDIACLDLSPIPAGRARTQFLAVGCFDGMVKIFNLDPTDLLDLLASVKLNEAPESLRFLTVSLRVLSNNENSTQQKKKKNAILKADSIYLFAGLRNGVCQRLSVDELSGDLTEPTSRFFGPRQIRLVRIFREQRPALLALSSKPWLLAPRREASQGPAALVEIPIAYDTLDFAASFKSEQCPEAIVAVAGTTLRIFVAELKQDDQTFQSQLVPTLYTPRVCINLPIADRQLLLIAETDQHRYTESEARALSIANKEKGDEDAMDIADDDDNNNKESSKITTEETTTENVLQEVEDEIPPLRIINSPIPPENGKWASCLRIIDPTVPNDVLELLELGENEAAVSCATCIFAGRPETTEFFLAVGTVKSLRFDQPGGRKHDGCFIHIYRLLESHRLVLLHKTPIEDIPLCLIEFRGRLMVSVGCALRLYDLGKRKLLRKTEHVRLVPNLIIKLQVYGDRIYACDSTESIFFAKYIRETNRFAVFADDPIPRIIASLCIIDYDTVAIGDKFGNIALLRLPPDADDEVDDPSGVSIYFAEAAPNLHKLQTIAQYHIGAIATSIIKTPLGGPGSDEALFFAAIDGRIGALVPSKTRDDKDFFTMLEMHLRQEYQHFFTGRDHISFRSAFAPVKDVVDGDLCLEFPFLSRDLQVSIARDLDRSPHEVYKKFQDTLNRLL